EALGIRPGRQLEAGLIDQPEVAPAIVAIGFATGVGGDHLPEVERAERRGRQRVPQTIVAAGPDEPGVATLDLVGGQRNAAIHVVEVVFGGCPERLRGARSVAASIEHLPGWRRATALQAYEGGEESECRQ